MAPANILTILAGLGLWLVCQLIWHRHYRPDVQAQGGALSERRMQFAGRAFRLAILLAVVALLGQALRGATAVILAVLAATIWAICETLILMGWKYLNISVLRLSRHMSFITAQQGAGRNIARATRSYLPLDVPVVLILGGAATMALAVSAPFSLPILSAIMALAAAAAWLYAASARDAVTVASAEIPFLALEDTLPAATLAAADRRPFVAPRAKQPEGLSHILLVLNESVGDDVTCHGGIDLADAICAASPDASAWLRPANPVTPSSCTDIALPCIFTGCAPEASAAKLHSLPMLFDLAKARGMTTLFYSASTLRWANFEAFFGAGEPAGAIDDLATPESTGLPFAHELGCDDHQMASLLCDRIRAADGPLFIVLYTYALHLPFQSESPLPIPDHIRDRRSRAAFLVEQAHRMVFDALHQSGRYDDTLIISIGDHGEASGTDTAARGGVSSRLTRLTNQVTRPLFVIKPPARLNAARRACLNNNMARLVSTIDIAPTIASLLELDLVGGDGGIGRYDGYDLTTQLVPTDRIHYSLTVNAWRTWPQAAVMIAGPDMRLCIDYQNGHALCCDGAGQPLSDDQRPAADALLHAAMAKPVVRTLVARVLRDKLRNRSQISTRQFAAVTPDVTRPVAMAGGYDRFFGHDIFDADNPAGRLHFGGRRHDAAGFWLQRRDRGILLYGPYVSLNPGRYAASFIFAPGARICPLVIDVCATGQDDIAAAQIDQLVDGRVASLTFQIDRPAEGLEVRLRKQHAGRGICLGLFITQIGDSPHR